MPEELADAIEWLKDKYPLSYDDPDLWEEFADEQDTVIALLNHLGELLKLEPNTEDD